MTWSNSTPMQEKRKFIDAYLSGIGSISALCREFGISRPSGYSLLKRYDEEGYACLKPRSRSAHCRPNATQEQVIDAMISIKRTYPSWGPEKIRAYGLQKQPLLYWPAASTIGNILKKHGLVKPRNKKRNRVPCYMNALTQATRANHVWCADFKGQFQIKQKWCYPLTVSDQFSRFLLDCYALKNTATMPVKQRFERLFMEYGLPDVIRTDNGNPFATTSPQGLSSLSVWWIKLGIIPERIAPGHPEQNGRHERMHRTLKQDAINPAAKTFRSQQNRFNQFINIYNHNRPHHALGQEFPNKYYEKSPKPYKKIIEPYDYPNHFMVRLVRGNGCMCYKGKDIFISKSLCHERIGIEFINEYECMIYFRHMKLVRLNLLTTKKL